MLWKKNVSKAQLAANRANAQKSRGPISPEGKAIVSKNRVVHGLTGRFEVLPNEDQERFNDLLDEYVLAEQPADIVETELVKKMAQHTWLSRRAARFQESCFVPMEPTPQEKAENSARIGVNHEIDRWLRYQAHHDRAYSRAQADLIKHRKEKQNLAHGFESQKRAEAQEERAASAEVRKAERFKTATALDQKRLELTDLKILSQTAAAAKRFNLFEPPKEAKIAA